MPRRLATLIAAISVTLIALVPTAATASDRAAHFTAQLSGAEEVPPNDSTARGAAVLQLSRDGSQLDYRLLAANIENTTMAHIHVAPPGANGPVVAWLYPPEPPPALIPGRFAGVLQTGTITASDLMGPLAGRPLEALLDEIRAGNAYVNVHTDQFPGGEIRGRLMGS